MTAAGQVRSEIVSRLKAAGLDAAEAYEDERRHGERYSEDAVHGVWFFLRLVR